MLRGSPPARINGDVATLWGDSPATRRGGKEAAGSPSVGQPDVRESDRHQRGFLPIIRLDPSLAIGAQVLPRFTSESRSPKSQSALEKPTTRHHPAPPGPAPKFQAKKESSSKAPAFHIVPVVISRQRPRLRDTPNKHAARQKRRRQPHPLPPRQRSTHAPSHPQKRQSDRIPERARIMNPSI